MQNTNLRPGQEVWIWTYVDQNHGFKYVPAFLDYRAEYDIWYLKDSILRWCLRMQITLDKPESSKCLDIRSLNELKKPSMEMN